jgi:uncharacterized protein (TIGR00369 family)
MPDAGGEVPDGFKRHFRRSPLTDPWEPLYSRRDGERLLLAVRVDVPHTNARGLAHGGLISALSDNAMGLVCALAVGNRGAVTVSLSLDFVGAVHAGQWLEVAADPIKLGCTLAFAQAVVTADGEPVARASAVFRMVGSKGN